MASLKGEVTFSADGQEYTLLLDFNALCDLEDDFPGLMDGKAELKSPKAIRRVFHAGLRAHHDDLTLNDAGRLIQAVGLEKAGNLVRASFEASFPTGGEGTKDPRKAPAKAGAGKTR